MVLLRCLMRAKSCFMPRYALKIEYHGAPFVGWQRQTDLPSVQGTIESALSRLQPGDHTIAAAGRTDAGVHALAQVAHCDLTREWTPFRLSEALNFHLRPLPIAIIDCARVDDDWHARFGANKRHYLFRLLSRRAFPTHDDGLVWQVKHQLDIGPMREAAEFLIGNHDFTTFRSTFCQAASPVKTLDKLDIEQIPVNGGIETRFTLSARSFLHNQVRSFVGSLERVGIASWKPEDMRTALAAKSRDACGPVSPPQGLYMSAVDYDDDPFL